jgi:serine phosphatase RsbU (regulator of sigma subunit)/Tfp pilus assembly protein PilF
LLATKYQFKEIEASLLNNRGVAFDYSGQYTSALESYFKALPIQEQRKNKDAQADILGNIGLVYMAQKRWQKALDYHRRALKIKREIKDQLGISASLNNIAIIYGWQKQYKKAIENYTECIRIDKELKDEQGLGDDYNNIAISYFNMRDYPRAVEYLNMALDIRLRADNRLGVCQTYNNFASVYQNQGIWTEAEKYYLLALPIAKALGAKESIKYIYENLHKVSARLKKMNEAYYYHKLFVHYRDELEDIDQLRLQAEVELNYKHEKEVEMQRLLQEKRNERSRLILVAVLSATMLLMGFAYTLYRRWKYSQRQKNEIEEKTALLEQKNNDILASIAYARRIQSAILPSPDYISEKLPDSFVLYIPKDIVAGDFYWLEEMGDKLFFAVADCTGHGVPGAMMSVVCHNALNRALYEFKLDKSNTLIEKTSQLILADLSKNSSSVNDGMDISLCIFDKAKRSVDWTGANIPLWIYRGKTKTIEVIKPDKQWIGLQSPDAPFSSQRIGLDVGDRIFLLTDGFADQFGGEKNRKLMAGRLREWLSKSSELSPREQGHFLEEGFMSWKGSLEQVDDVCIVGIAIND